jgi:hypothetical protein
MQRKYSKLQNDLSRFLGGFGLFWTCVLAYLGIPFFVIGLILAIKNKDTTEGLTNILFNAINLILSILYIIFSILLRN